MEDIITVFSIIQENPWKIPVFVLLVFEKGDGLGDCVNCVNDFCVNCVDCVNGFV
jgi:hypothetical protein